MSQPKCTIAVADDHALFRSGLVRLIHSFGDQYKVVLQAGSGSELLAEMRKGIHIDIVLLDLNMPGMNGFDTAGILHREFPECRVLVITMSEEEEVVIRMLRKGIRGYLGKDVEPEELQNALHSTMSTGYYYNRFITEKLLDALNPRAPRQEPDLSQRERDFIALACSEYTYKEIAEQMRVSAKTVDGYRDALFDKLQVRSRVGLVLYAVRNELVQI